MSIAFVTGAGSGFGLATARLLLESGHQVVATDLRVDGLADKLASAGPPDRLLIVAVDVRLRANVEHAASLARARFGPVDLVINNAGYAIFATIEEADLDDISDMFAVNVLGVARVSQAFLADLRATRGTIVNISSVAGRMVFAESGFYAGTKHAVEAMSDGLFAEVAPHGVRVRVIEPGSFSTGFQERATSSSPTPPASSPYAAQRARWAQVRAEVLESDQGPELVARAIVASLVDPRPFMRIPVGVDAPRILGLKDRLAPDGWTRQAAAHAGWQAPGRYDGDLPGPREVIARWGDRGVPGPWPEADRAFLDALVAARDAGYLGHWKALPDGPLALALLSTA